MHAVKYGDGQGRRPTPYNQQMHPQIGGYVYMQLRKACSTQDRSETPLPRAQTPTESRQLTILQQGNKSYTEEILEALHAIPTSKQVTWRRNPIGLGGGTEREGEASGRSRIIQTGKTSQPISGYWRLCQDTTWSCTQHLTKESGQGNRMDKERSQVIEFLGFRIDSQQMSMARQVWTS